MPRHNARREMTVYLIARTGVLKRHFGYLELWAKALSGKSDHVEIAFIRDRVLYACYVTKWSVVAVFCRRDLSGLLENGVLAWYRLDGISHERELRLEERCRDLVASGDYYFSAIKMMYSAMPFRDPAVAKLMEGTAQPVVVRTVSSAKEGAAAAAGASSGSAHLRKANASAWDTSHKRSTYCAALCAEILGFPDPEQYTASDIVILCQEKLRAQLVDKPVFDTGVPAPVRDQANIVRASEAVDWLVWDGAGGLV